LRKTRETGRLGRFVEGRSDYFTTPRLDGVRLHTLHWGDPAKPGLILLHGGGANAHWWDHLAPSLAGRFHVVALDFRGHGDSDHPTELRSGAFYDDARALVEHIGSEEVALVGHSMGGHVALDYASRHPTTRGVCAIDVARGAQRRSRRSARLALAFRRTYRTRDDAIDRFRFLPAAEHCSEALRTSIARHSIRREPDGRYGYKFDPRWFGVRPDRRPDLSGVRCPVLLLRGSESSLLTAEGVAALVAELRDAELLEIAGAGHHVQLDRPDEVLVALLGFLPA
jgi:pimeloyl-ACP methyl ester carboxylesterase